ncbi:MULTISPECIES: hypothetical protein [Rothia]|uniref:hypothetical protein n=1 Tax=Rothia TaxID=32207 RepID=UPI0009F5AD96|nr:MULTISPECIES: hypothetical protein [Rothia]
MSSEDKTTGTNRPSFKETFVAVGQRTLDKDRRNEGVYIVSVAPIVTGLMVLAALLYAFTHGWGTLVALLCALIVLWGRWVLQRQAAKDFADMYTSQEGYRSTGKPEYAEFIQLRAEQMLRDNKALTQAARAEVSSLLAWAQEQQAKQQ